MFVSNYKGRKDKQTQIDWPQTQIAQTQIDWPQTQ